MVDDPRAPHDGTRVVHGLRAQGIRLGKEGVQVLVNIPEENSPVRHFPLGVLLPNLVFEEKGEVLTRSNGVLAQNKGAAIGLKGLVCHHAGRHGLRPGARLPKVGGQAIAPRPVHARAPSPARRTIATLYPILGSGLLLPRSSRPRALSSGTVQGLLKLSDLRDAWLRFAGLLSPRGDSALPIVPRRRSRLVSFGRRVVLQVAQVHRERVHDHSVDFHDLALREEVDPAQRHERRRRQKQEERGDPEDGHIRDAWHRAKPPGRSLPPPHHLTTFRSGVIGASEGVSGRRLALSIRGLRRSSPSRHRPWNRTGLPRPSHQAWMAPLQYLSVAKSSLLSCSAPLCILPCPCAMGSVCQLICLLFPSSWKFVAEGSWNFDRRRKREQGEREKREQGEREIESRWPTSALAGPDVEPIDDSPALRLLIRLGG